MSRHTHLQSLSKLAQLQRIEELRSDVRLRDQQSYVHVAETVLANAEQGHEVRRTEYDGLFKENRISTDRLRLATILLAMTEEEMNRARNDCGNAKDRLEGMAVEHLSMRRHGEGLDQRLKRAERRSREDRDQKRADEVSALLLHRKRGA